MITAAQIRPGDAMLYRPVGLFGHVIAVKTWHPISHVEIYTGEGFSVASRDGLGTGRYPWRLSELAYICRPWPTFDLAAALGWFGKQPHRPYGWLELLEFVGLTVNKDGIVCSPFATEFYRAGGLDPFNGEPADKIAPFEFVVSPVFTVLPYGA